MIQKITQNNGNFWTFNLIMRAKIVNQSSDFPVRRTGSYRHKKSTAKNAPPCCDDISSNLYRFSEFFYCRKPVKFLQNSYNIIYRDT